MSDTTVYCDPSDVTLRVTSDTESWIHSVLVRGLIDTARYAAGSQRVCSASMLNCSVRRIAGTASDWSGGGGSDAPTLGASACVPHTVPLKMSSATMRQYAGRDDFTL